MKRILLILIIVFVCFGFFCPNPPKPINNLPPMAPIIDSIVTGIDINQKEGVWIFFHPSLNDTNQDLAGFNIYKKTQSDTTPYKSLYTSLPPNTWRVFDDDIQFADYGKTNIYRYKMTAFDSGYPIGLSDTCAPESISVTSVADSLRPINNDTIKNNVNFSWKVYGLHSGFKMFIGVGKKDTLYWSQQVCPPLYGCNDIIVQGVEQNFFDINYNYDLSASIKTLEPGYYWWWLKIKWSGSHPISESIKHGSFRIKQ